MTFRRAAASFLLAAMLWASAPPPAARSAETQALASRLRSIYLTGFDEAINRHAFRQRDGTTYISTGDIAAEWLRDASAVLEPYIGVSMTDAHVREQLRGAIAREGKYVLVDPYANAFNADYRVFERKFEEDSLMYPIWFADKYLRATGDRSIFTPELNRAFERILATLRTEQRHDRQSTYRHPALAYNGRGTPSAFTGMVWTGFRPSDDPARYHYNIPENMFASVVLRKLSDIERNVYRNDRDAVNAWGLAVQIQRGIEKYGTTFLPPFGRIYAYEVDGFGHANAMDDANLPSLLSIPYIGYLPAADPIYLSTRRFVLSARNPYYYTGKAASGVGSPHTPPGYVWPLALVVQALTSGDPAEIERVLGMIAASDTGDHRLHESFNANDPSRYTREDFAWPNALYAELVLTRSGTGKEWSLLPVTAGR